MRIHRQTIFGKNYNLVYHSNDDSDFPYIIEITEKNGHIVESHLLQKPKGTEYLRHVLKNYEKGR